ncbi:helix-turn-helix transcriptional regulator [Acrocarpospora macrocephala]|nr:helix-turn-helix transcriptional regulator [Acrocarpospora macrocephala]
MDARGEIREFLTSRRARLRTDDVGLVSYGHRRVPGLRREEVAVLAGISAPYYARLERGDLTAASDAVLDAVARALRLNPAERAHLADLARATRRPAAAAGSVDPVRDTRVRPVLRQLIDAFEGAAAFVSNERIDVLAANRTGAALCSPLFEYGGPRPNLARFVFLTPAGREFFVDWDTAASDVVASLRSSAGRNPHDEYLTGLIGELTARSDAFSSRWAAHDVKSAPSGVKVIRHPLVGLLELHYEQLGLPSDPRQAIFTFSAPRGSHAYESLGFLASWISSNSTRTE